MSRSIDVLERIARSADAVFAFDANDLLILWNRGCERLLGRTAHQVLGRRCHDVLAGRDVYGNRYCERGCPIATQARAHATEPIQRFLLDAPAVGGATRRLAVTTFVLPASRPSLSAIVHVLRDADAEPCLLERDLAQAILEELPPAAPVPETAETSASRLTGREHDVLCGLSRGLSTDGIARELFISQVTVRNHSAKILLKLNVHTKLAAVVLAYQTGLVEPLPAVAMRPIAHDPEESGPARILDRP